MGWEFATAGRILFGSGTSATLGTEAARFGRRVLVVTGANPERTSPVVDRLRVSGIDIAIFRVCGEPRIDDARAGVEAALTHRAELVIGIGGGSAIDAGKAVSVLATHDGDPLDYLEVIGKGRAFSRPALPFIAVPTTAGTGSEVTRNAVLASPEHGVKASLRGPQLLPRLALVDPDLAANLPPDVTAATGLDAIAQLVEPFVSLRATPMIDALVREALPVAARSIRIACREGTPEARRGMAFAALASGMALANGGLGAVHGLAAVVGGRARASHGTLCARFLGPVIAANLAALAGRTDGSAALARYAEVGRMLTGNPDATGADAADWVETLCLDLCIPRLAEHGVLRADFEAIAEQAMLASSTRANPVTLRKEEMIAILERTM
jgi:alcohol dehydrogenase class IV